MRWAERVARRVWRVSFQREPHEEEKGQTGTI